MNLLLIDDDMVDRANTVRTLNRSGYALNITEAETAEDGLGQYKKATYDIVLLDYQLPTMTGLELLKLFNSDSHECNAVVMISNHDDEDLAISCIENGAQDFIPKSELSSSRLIRAIMHAKERYKIDQQLRRSHEQLKVMAERDALTGLSNRYVFEEEMTTAIPRAERQGVRLALLMLDLDCFKVVNDTLGHAAGDRLLVEVAKRLSAQVRGGDLLCRLGGDEFAILVHNLADPIMMRLFSQRIFAAFSTPFILEEIEFTISASIGIAVYPDCAQDAMQLMKCADVAMYRSKEKGRGRASYYSQALHEEVSRRIELERELRRATVENEFVLYYQPQVDCMSESLVGAEALIRWQHPEKGLISPVEFIPIAEEIGLIPKIGDWVLETACAQLQRWHKNKAGYGESFSISVNISALELNQQGFFAKVEKVIEQYDIAPQLLELEVTESTLINSTAETAQILKDLSDYGITLSLDDFGTGYSSLSQLQTYPFEVLKVDRSFVQSIEDNDEGAQFLEAINALAKVLGIKTVVEGVERETQKGWCQKLGFDRMQGYYFAKPLPAAQFEKQFL
ncbi:two-component system response regulator [Kiloniella laminariae]|uniref:two-component system response regulator n=1 Tax=Kiloniella laminariae TaxID=454162 RepID=UPI0003767B0C|nr:GGDEF domain-containing response regulator [Kiloniella laminariae]